MASTEVSNFLPLSSWRELDFIPFGVVKENFKVRKK
jgi:hypothetical protein